MRRYPNPIDLNSAFDVVALYGVFGMSQYDPGGEGYYDVLNVAPLTGSYIQPYGYFTANPSIKKVSQASLQPLEPSSGIRLPLSDLHRDRTQKELDLEGLDFTISAWAYSTDGYNFFILSKPSSSGSDGWFFRVDPATRTLWFTREVGGSTTFSVSGTVSSLPNNTWIHYTAERYKDVVTLYVNGVPVGSAKANGENFSVDTGTSLWIGAAPGRSPRLTGYIDDLRFTRGWARYRGPFTPTTTYTHGYRLLLHFDGLQGSTYFPDSGPLRRQIQTIGAPRLDQGQKVFGTASLYLDGSSALYYWGDLPTDFPITYTNWALDCWVRFTSTTTNQTIMSWGSSYKPSFLQYRYSGGQGQWVYRYNSLEGTIVVRNISISPGTWYHLAISHNDKKFRIFHNGVQQGEAQMIYDFYPPSASSPIVGGLPLSIGQNNEGEERMTGWIDELCVTATIPRFVSNFSVPTAPYDLI